MYARSVEGTETTFGVSGALWRDSLIFYDRDSRSYWSQVDGRAVGGPREGAKLEKIPSVLTSWSEWKREHPDTLVLRKPPGADPGTPYADYYQDAEKMGVLGRSNPDPRLGGKRTVLGIVAGTGHAAVPLDALSRAGTIAAEAGGVPLLAVTAGPSDGHAFDRRAGGHVLDLRLEADGRLRDAQTGSVWQLPSGRAVEGPLAGESLQRLDARRMYWFIWASFHPGTVVLDAAAEAPGGS